jgi:hypothetical protein
MKTTLPFLFICTQAPSLEPLYVLNLDKKSTFKNIAEVIDDVQFFKAIGIRSNYKNPFKAKFARTGEVKNDALNSRVIKSFDRPIRHSTTELIEFLESFRVRGKDRKPRQIHPNSLKNLQKAAAWTAETKPTKPRQISDETIAKADAMKANGMSWRQIGDKLLINFSSIRSAINRRNKALQKKVLNEGHFSEKLSITQAKNIVKNNL